MEMLIQNRGRIFRVTDYEIEDGEFYITGLSVEFKGNYTPITFYDRSSKRLIWMKRFPEIEARASAIYKEYCLPDVDKLRDEALDL